MLDVDGHVISWGQGAEKIKGYAREEILGSHFSRFYPPEALARNLPAYELEVAAATGRFEDTGWRVRKDGSLFWANVIITRMTGPGGEVVGFSKITRDLTEWRAQDLTLRQSEERFRLLVSGVKDYAIFMLDPGGHVATWNAGARQIKGYAANEIIGSHFSRFYPPEAIKRNLPATELQGALMQGRFEDEGWRLRKDGSRFWANVIITAVRNPAGQLIGFSKITRDLSERRRHEEELRQSEERFRLLVDGVTEYAIMMLDAEGFVASWNAGAERIKGYKSPEILGKHFSHFYPAEAITANQPWEDLTRAQNEGQVASEGWRVRKDGTLFWASSVITALRDHDKHLYGFAKVTQDLTQRRQAEALADTARRMHEFIAMLAHELRNPLAPIRNAVALMGRKGLNDPTLEAMRKTIDRQSMQLVRLLDELLEVVRVRVATRGFAGRVEFHRDRADRVAQVPQGQRPGLVHDVRDRRHVGQGPAAVGHVRQADQRGAGIDGVAKRPGVEALVHVGADDAQLTAALLGDPLQDVAIGREVVVVGEDDAAPWPRVQGGAGQLVQVDGGRVAHRDLAGRGPDQVLAQEVADLAGQVDPAVPGPDQARPPLLRDHLGDAVPRRARQRAERIAVQIYRGRDVPHEPAAEPGQRIGRVQFLGVGPFQGHRRHGPNLVARITMPFGTIRYAPSRPALVARARRWPGWPAGDLRG